MDIHDAKDKLKKTTSFVLSSTPSPLEGEKESIDDKRLLAIVKEMTILNMELIKRDADL